MKALMNSLMTCAVLCMMCTSAFAGGDGGGGAKGDGTIVVTNNFPGYVMVVAVGDFSGGATVSEFLAAGAQFVQPGESASFSAAPGSHNVNAIFINDTLFTTAGPATATVNVVADQTTSVSGEGPGVLN